MELSKNFLGPNAGYIIELYEQYLDDPSSVDSETRAQFELWTPEEVFDLEHVTTGEYTPQKTGDARGLIAKTAAAINLAQAIRINGHLSARLDPLGSSPPGDPWHEFEFHGITEEDLQQLPGDIIGGPLSKTVANALDGIHALQGIYSNQIGYDYGHIQTPTERNWLRNAAESGQFRPPSDPIDEVGLLERLTQVEVFEQFLHRIFPGKTRFSIEGVDILVPMLDVLMNNAAQSEICSVLVGMAHRGRLNVLAHILGKPYAQILAEFKDPVSHFPTRDELGWTGDVKYHMGAHWAVREQDIIELVASMPSNPSHLEHINPVILGMARASGSKVNQPGAPQFFPMASLPILIHGDASFSGQGVVAETLNLSRIPGYSVGGSIHIITNNQLGYTTTPEEGRSTLYASDLAKGFEIPVIHVNSDDPVGCLEAVRTAFAYRQKFLKDFLIDLIGYRRYGHNEGDEPAFTQPLMYEKIDGHPSVRAIWAQKLSEKGQISEDSAEERIQKYMNDLQQILANLEPEEEISEPLIKPAPRGAAKHVHTSVPKQTLIDLNQALLELPSDFKLHRKLERARHRRLSIFDDLDQASIDWSTAEELALASILVDGTPIRMTGEDVQRGTFSQRHAIFHDTENGSHYAPLQHIPQAKAAFEILNSPLSENSTLGFEFGYNSFIPNRLVIWEAQYGDFVTTAQTMIDEFLVSARAKWEQTPSLVMLLPHGDEGQGPDHSSGRPERFLQLAADINLRLANCTTAAQYFHLLRRQALLLETDPLPLIVMTPKSLLRHPLVASKPGELIEGQWQPVINDDRNDLDPRAIRRVVLCSGKIFVDLVSSDLRNEASEIAILRVEQIYPFPEAELMEILENYPALEEIVWVQEEPENMGAWSFVQPIIRQMINGRWKFTYIGRPDNASPAEGSSAWHSYHQKSLIEQTFRFSREKIGLKED